MIQISGWRQMVVNLFLKNSPFLSFYTSCFHWLHFLPYDFPQFETVQRLVIKADFLVCPSVRWYSQRLNQVKMCLLVPDAPCPSPSTPTGTKEALGLFPQLQSLLAYQATRPSLTRSRQTNSILKRLHNNPKESILVWRGLKSLNNVTVIN